MDGEPTVRQLVISLISVITCGTVFVAVRGKARFAVGFSVTSALLLYLNKLALTFVPSPAMVVGSQLLSTWAATYAVSDVEPLRKDICLDFWPVPVVFLMLLLAASSMLEHLELEVQILTRTVGALPVCIFEYFFLNANPLSAQSAAVIVVSVILSCIYCWTEHGDDADFVLKLGPCLQWMAVFCFDQIFIKARMNKVKLSPWTNVRYTNALGAIVLAPFMLEELSRVTGCDVYPCNPKAWIPFAAALIIAPLMSYFAFGARGEFSATTFSVLGTVSKLLSVLCSMLALRRRATVIGVTAVCLNILVFAFYKDAGRRPDTTPSRGEEERRLSRGVAWAGYLSVIVNSGIRGYTLASIFVRQGQTDVWGCLAASACHVVLQLLGLLLSFWVSTRGGLHGVLLGQSFGCALASLGIHFAHGRLASRQLEQAALLLATSTLGSEACARSFFGRVTAKMGRLLEGSQLIEGAALIGLIAGALLPIWRDSSSTETHVGMDACIGAGAALVLGIFTCCEVPWSYRVNSEAAGSRTGGENPIEIELGDATTPFSGSPGLQHAETPVPKNSLISNLRPWLIFVMARAMCHAITSGVCWIPSSFFEATVATLFAALPLLLLMSLREWLAGGGAHKLAAFGSLTVAMILVAFSEHAVSLGAVTVAVFGIIGVLATSGFNLACHHHLWGLPGVAEWTGELIQLVSMQTLLSNATTVIFWLFLAACPDVLHLQSR